jgi:hypothetical protein
MVYRAPITPDVLFDVDECRNSTECNLTFLLNERALPWLNAGAGLVGPVLQQYGERKLVFFLDTPDGRLLRVEFHDGCAVAGHDLTGQGGPDLDPNAPGVLTASVVDGDLCHLATQVADFLDVLVGVQRC